MAIGEIAETIIVPNPVERIETFGHRELAGSFQVLGRISTEWLGFPTPESSQDTPLQLEPGEEVTFDHPIKTGVN